MFIFTLKYSQLQVIQQQKFKCIGKTILQKIIVFVLMCTYTYNNTSKKNIVEKRKCNESITEVNGCIFIYMFQANYIHSVEIETNHWSTLYTT